MIALLLTRWRAVQGVIGLLAALFLFATALHYRHAYHAEIALRQADRAAYVTAQAIATQKALAALVATETAYRSKANEADKSYRAELADARSSADRYIASHRVRGSFAGPASGAASAAEDHASGVLQPVPTDAFVAVSDRDVQVCTDAYVYAVNARGWALSLAK